MSQKASMTVCQMSICFISGLTAQGCGNSSSTLAVPKVATMVSSSLPAGLKPGGTTIVTPSALYLRAEMDLLADTSSKLFNTAAVTPSNTNGNLAAGYLINLFQNTFSSASGFVQGYLMAQV